VKVGGLGKQRNTRRRHLKLEMLEYAEGHPSAEADNGRRYLKIFINDFDTELESIVIGLRYRKIQGVRECWSLLLVYQWNLLSGQDARKLGEKDRTMPTVQSASIAVASNVMTTNLLNTSSLCVAQVYVRSNHGVD